MRLDLVYVTPIKPLSRKRVGGCAVYDSLLLQNRISSTESAHANTEASVSRQCLDSSGKTMD